MIPSTQHHKQTHSKSTLPHHHHHRRQNPPHTQPTISSTSATTIPIHSPTRRRPSYHISSRSHAIASRTLNKPIRDSTYTNTPRTSTQVREQHPTRRDESGARRREIVFGAVTVGVDGFDDVGVGARVLLRRAAAWRNSITEQCKAK